MGGVDDQSLRPLVADALARIMEMDLWIDCTKKLMDGLIKTIEVESSSKPSGCRASAIMESCTEVRAWYIKQH